MHTNARIDCLAPITQAARYLLSPQKALEIALGMKKGWDKPRRRPAHARHPLMSRIAPLLPLPLTFILSLLSQYGPKPKTGKPLLYFLPRFFISLFYGSLVFGLLFNTPLSPLVSLIVAGVVVFARLRLRPFKRDAAQIAVFLTDIGVILVLGLMVDPVLAFILLSSSFIVFSFAQMLLAITLYPGLNLVPREMAYNRAQTIIGKWLRPGDLFFMAIFTTAFSALLSVPLFYLAFVFILVYASLLVPGLLDQVQTIFPKFPARKISQNPLMRLPYTLFANFVSTPLRNLFTMPRRKPKYKPRLFPLSRNPDVPNDKDIARYFRNISKLEGKQLRRYLRITGPRIDRYIDEIIQQQTIHHQDLYHLKILSFCTIVSYWHNHPGLYGNDPEMMKQAIRYLLPRVRISKTAYSANSSGRFSMSQIKRYRRNGGNFLLFITTAHEIGHMIHVQNNQNLLGTTSPAVHEIYAMLASMALLEAHGYDQKNVIRKYRRTLHAAMKEKKPTEEHQLAIRIIHDLLGLGYHSIDLLHALDRIVRQTPQYSLGRNARVDFAEEILLITAA